jgi:uncharacterized integral membrane protein
MNFLKAIFWILILVIFAFLAASNWHNVPIILIPNQAEISINLPLLMAITFLIGFLPYFIMHRMTRWSLRKKLSAAKRELEATKHEPITATPAQDS